MKIAIAATNPCHLFPLARELARSGALGCYYSGYPVWKLAAPSEMPVRTHALRTTIVYGALKYLPENLRPGSRSLFLWQDHGFDSWVGRHLDPCDFIHAMPGQALHTFQAARRLGIPAVLNHATGPVRDWVRIMAPEYERVGLKLTEVCPYDDVYFAREAQEYDLAAYHCVASTVVRDQLIAIGIPPERIWLSPYGADPEIFHARLRRTESAPFRVLFAGQVGLRKDLRTLLGALEKLARPEWEMHFYGGVSGEARPDLAAYRGKTPLTCTAPSARKRWPKVSVKAPCSCFLHWKKASASSCRRPSTAAFPASSATGLARKTSSVPAKTAPSFLAATPPPSQRNCPGGASTGSPLPKPTIGHPPPAPSSKPPPAPSTNASE